MLNSQLKSFNTCKRIFLLIVLTMTLPALLITLNCGKRKPPLPPVERVQQRVEIWGIQRGNSVVISWTMPARNASDKSILNISRADIYRLAEKQNVSQALTEEEFAASSTLIATVPISDSDFGLKKLFYTDELEFSGQPARLRYAIRFVNAQGQKAAFSNFLIIEPAPKIADAPKNLQAAVNEQSIALTWESPKNNVDGSTPVNLLGYNVYRTSVGMNTAKLLNTAPITKTEYSDRTFEFDKEYNYLVRAVSLGSNGAPVESIDSNSIKILPKDIFAPGAPTAITIAAAPSNLSIFFAVNPEKDIAGYRIYRSTDASLPKSDWQVLTPQILKTNTFQDKTVETGKTYYYYIVAIDNAGNVSSPSDVFSETVP